MLSWTVLQKRALTGVVAERLANGTVGQKISRANAEWRKDFEETLPDLREGR